ncbi:MAG: transcriptional repressor LexA [Spirochaetota bacterium]
MYLTEKQKEIYRFIEQYIKTRKIAPSYEEIKNHFGFKSISTVFDHIQTLEKKGVVARGGTNQKRALQLVNFGKRSVSIPLVATVAAGRPLEAYEIEESVDVPEEMLSGGENVALRVKGNSMIESGIFDGDIVIVRRQSTAENGQIVVALIDGEATIKRIYYHGDTIELRASNPEIAPIFVGRGQNFEIYGVLVGMYRRFNV